MPYLDLVLDAEAAFQGRLEEVRELWRIGGYVGWSAGHCTIPANNLQSRRHVSFSTWLKRMGLQYKNMVNKNAREDAIKKANEAEAKVKAFFDGPRKARTVKAKKASASIERANEAEERVKSWLGG